MVGWVGVKPINYISNTTFNILYNINLNYLIFFIYVGEYIELSWSFYRYYKYLWVKFILLIFMGLYLKLNL